MKIVSAFWLTGKPSAVLLVPLTYSEALVWVVQVHVLAFWVFSPSWVLVGSLPLLLPFVEPPFSPDG